MSEDIDNPQDFANSELTDLPAAQVPGSAGDLGTRIKALCRQVGWTEMAGQTDRSVKQLRRYAHGDDPPFSVLARLASVAGVSLEWLATGEGPMRRDQAPPDPAARPADQARANAPPPAIDGDFFGLVLEGVKATYADVNARIDDRQAGKTAARIYDDIIAATADDPDPGPGRRAALNMGLAQLRRDLLTPSLSSKHSGSA